MKVIRVDQHKITSVGKLEHYYGVQIIWFGWLSIANVFFCVCVCVLPELKINLKFGSSFRLYRYNVIIMTVEVGYYYRIQIIITISSYTYLLLLMLSKCFHLFEKTVDYSDSEYTQELYAAPAVHSDVEAHQLV